VNTQKRKLIPDYAGSPEPRALQSSFPFELPGNLTYFAFSASAVPRQIHVRARRSLDEKPIFLINQVVCAEFMARRLLCHL